MKILVAIDSLKGSLSSMEAGSAIAEGIGRVYGEKAEIIVRPLADGGEGTVEALVSGMDGRMQRVTVTGPLGKPVECEYGIIENSHPGSALMPATSPDLLVFAREAGALAVKLASMPGMRPSEIVTEKSFENAILVHAALSEQSCETVLAAIKTAKKYGTVVSYDLNYRPSMWSAIGGLEKAQEVNKEIAKYVDVMIGNEEDFTACLGFEIEGNDKNLKELNLDGYKKMINHAAEVYPNFKAVATTLREVKTATVNDWSTLCWADGEIYHSNEYKGLEIMDRVGGGDSFASGLIYGLMTTGNAETAVNYGAAHGALAMTTPGDTTMASKKEVEAIMSGAGARVKR